MKRIAFAAGLALAACGSSSATQPAPEPAPARRPPGEHGPRPVIISCDDAKPNVTALYDAAAKATDQALHDPTFVDDNVGMVMKDCAAEPMKIAPCAKIAASVEALERDCLPALDEEGTEGGRIAK